MGDRVDLPTQEAAEGSHLQVTDEAVSQCEAALLDAFNICRQAFDPSFARRYGGQKWRETAHALLLKGFSPYRYVRFVEATINGGVIYENMVCSPKFIALFEKAMPSIREAARLELLCSLERLSILSGFGTSIEDQLKDPYNGIPVILRYVLVKSQVGSQQFADKLEPAAKRMLLFEPYYGEFLIQLLPADQQQVVRGLYGN